MNNLMLDLETFGKKAGAAIVSIAAVQFDLATGKTGKTFYQNIDLQSCLNAGLKVSGDTVMWWMKQEEKARRKLTENTLDIQRALSAFNEFIDSIPIDEFAEYNDLGLKIWGNSARFDLGILEVAYTALKAEAPWKYYNERDVRTLVSFAPEIKQNMTFEGVPHDALADCYHQIKYCSAIYQKLFN